MKRLLIGLPLFAVIGGGSAVLWLRAEGGSVPRLSEDELVAAQESGEAGREIGVAAVGDELPTLAALKDCTDRAKVEQWARAANEALAEAAGSERADLLVLTAELERLRGNIGRAIELAREGAELLPANSRAREVHARALLSKLANDGQGVGALFKNLGVAKTLKAEVEAAFELDPSNHDARVKLILLHEYGGFVLGGDKREADALVEGIAEFKPAFDRDFWRARLLVDRGKLDDALAAFRALDAAKPDDPDVVANIGELLVQRKDWEGAARTFDRIVGAGEHPRHFEAYFQAAKARELGGFELERAVELLRRLLELDPLGDVIPAKDRIKFQEGVVLTRLGRFDEARAALAESDRILPGTKRIETALAEIDRLEAEAR